MNIKLTGRPPQGTGKYLFVVVKKDTDNYKGLWMVNSKEELREILILENMDSDNPNDPVYDKNFTYEEDHERAEKYIDYDFYFEKIGETV
jgi:hypothetical protein